MKRYRLICVADLPDAMSTDDFDEAMINTSAHYEVFDTVTGKWHGPSCQEEYDHHMHRWRYKQEEFGTSTRFWVDRDDTSLVVGNGISFAPVEGIKSDYFSVSRAA